MTINLPRYDAACRAIAEAKSIDEARELLDRAEAVRAYARQAKNRDLEADAGEIRFRAERRLGELQAETPKNGGGRPSKTGSAKEPVSHAPTLAELGIDKKLSARSQKLAAVPEAEFEGLLAGYRQQVIDAGERVSMNLLRAGDRATREASLADKSRAISERIGHQVYNVILSDPPWRLDPYSRVTGLNKAADNHYPTMSLDQIARLDVAGAAAPDCALFLWATAPMLIEALHVMREWGFQYRSHLIWLKDRIGTGYWSRNKHELLLIGGKGAIMAPEPGTQPESVIAAPRSRHSEKPQRFHEIIEKIYPGLPKLEMFARRRRPGWDSWGNETDD